MKLGNTSYVIFCLLSCSSSFVRLIYFVHDVFYFRITFVKKIEINCV